MSHAAEPDLGGFNDESEWDSYPYSATAPLAAMHVEYFRYWRTATGMITRATTTATATTPTTTEEPATMEPTIPVTCDQPAGSPRNSYWDCAESYAISDWGASAFTADWNTTVDGWSGQC